MERASPLDQLLEVAHRRALLSLEAARELQSEGFADPAFVWAVRSVEIFTKEWMLAPAYMTHEGLDLSRAMKRASRKFGSSNWQAAFHEIERLCGPIDPMLTEANADAWLHWQKRAVTQRGDIVHGRPASSATPEEVSSVIAYAGQLIDQLTLRMLTTDRHPAGSRFRSALQRGIDAVHGASLSNDPEEAPG